MQKEELQQQLNVENKEEQNIQQTNTNNYFKNFKEQLIQKYGRLSQEQLLQKLIDSEIQNKKLSNRLTELEPFKQKNLRVPNAAKSARLFEEFQSKKFALKICYLGHLYDGMALQLQTDNTVEEYLFRCMHTLNLIQTPRPGAQYTRAGRTDKGVSAMGNVIALKLRTKTKKRNATLKNQNEKKQNETTQPTLQVIEKQEKQLNYCDMLNSILPDDIRILACQPVQQEFNARYWCKQRSYKYFFVKNNLNIEAMKQAIKSFEGKHNFINFCKMNLSNTVNFEREIIRANIIKVDNEYEHHEGWMGLDHRTDVYYFHFVGNSFLWHQIRFMSSVLFMVGQGTEAVTIVEDLLNVEKFPRKPNYTMAPQYPLILQDCLYDGLQFKPNPQTIFKFYNTFHEMICKNAIEQTLIVNCMHMAKRDLAANIKISDTMFIEGVLDNYKRTHKVNKKSMQLHKASGRGMQEAIKSLKGKKKELYEKKAQKQADYEAKQKQRIRQQNELKKNEQPMENEQQQ